MGRRFVDSSVISKNQNFQIGQLGSYIKPEMAQYEEVYEPMNDENGSNSSHDSDHEPG